MSDQKEKIKQLLDCIKTDFKMLKEGSWVPDDDSINSSINNIENIEELINKSVEVDNKNFTSEQIDNALDCLHGDNSCDHSNVINFLQQYT